MSKPKKKASTKEIWSNNLFGLKEVYSFSKKRVYYSLLKQITNYSLWVFYSAFFVRLVLDNIEKERPLKDVLISISIIGGASLLLRAIIFYSDNVIFPLEDTRIYKGIYNKIFRKSENVELNCYDNTEFYNKYTVALDNIGDKLSANVDNICEIAGGIIGGIIAFKTMIEIDPITVLFLIAPLIGNFVFAPRMNNIYYNRYKDGVPYDRRIEYVNRVMYLEKYSKELRLYNVFNVIKKILDDATNDKSNIWKKYFKKAYILGIIQYIFSYVIIFEGILLYGSYRALVSNPATISFSEMAVLTSVMVMASWVWVRVINAYNRSSETGLVIAELRNYLSYEEKIPENQDGKIPSESVEEIEFRNVSFAYTEDKKIIDGLSFKIKKGEKVALVGHNGAGKTTIIKLLLRLYDPTEGTIYVNGVDIKEYNLKKYRELFACAFQDYKIFAGTVRDNILLGEDGLEEDIQEAITLAGIDEKINGFENGIDTILTKEFDEKGVLMSGGEFQKLACARVFRKKNKVFVFDEPSSALDPISENELFDSIINSVNSETGIFISHRLSCVKDAQKVFMLEKGRILEQGSHGDLMKNNGAYSEMYKIQEKNYFSFEGA